MVLTQFNSQFAETGGHCPSEGRDKAFSKNRVITCSMSHVTCWMRYPLPKSQR